MKKLLVLGVGNILLMDEGVGVHAVHAFLEEEWPEGVEFIDGGTFTQDMFDVFKGYEKVLVLDVVRGGKAPGTVYRLTENQLKEDQDQSLSLHDIDLLDSLAMAELLGNKPELSVLGIEPAKIDWGMEFTPEIQAVYPKFLTVARAEILKILRS